MADNPVHFGTSGWRGVIAEDFTFANVRLASAAIAQHLLSQSGKPRVIIGYDTRFLSEKFAATVSETLASHGVETWNCSRPDPTPALAHEILHSRLDGGINITASHNPPEYNGLKFSSSDGAPAMPDVTKEIEQWVGRGEVGEYSLHGPKFTGPLKRPANPMPAYLEALRQKIDLSAITNANLKIAFDPLYGTARGYLDELLQKSGAQVYTLHNFRDVLFSGAGPEPSEKNLSELAAFVKSERCVVGLSTDGDADRFGVVDADGTWIHPNYILALLADYLIEVRRIPGGVGRSVATTHLIDAVAKFHNVPVYQTPVGFKYLGELIKEDKIVLGGEESAGMSIRGHLPEKDGILACLLVAEMVARCGSTVKQQLEKLFKKVGPCFTIRVNLALTPEAQKGLRAKLQRDYDKFDGRKVVELDRTDGLKMICDDGSWVLMRPSGTEPVVRLYCESASQAELEKLMNTAKAFAVNP